MASIFSQIIAGDIPGLFIWQDELSVAILTIAPVSDGHVLVIPREEIDHWDELPPATAGHLMHVSQKIAAAIKSVYHPRRVGLIIAGLEVPHTHLHVLPINDMGDFDFSKAAMVDAQLLVPIAAQLKQALLAQGCVEADC
jgi:diadenosine tetraphosphate (Ap4A) HIT family hydrolase